MKKHSLVIGALGLLTLAIPATAAAQGAYGYGYNAPARNTACEQQRKDDKVAGTVIGAIGGALIGGAIGNNVEDGDKHWHRGRRGYRGHRRHRGYYHGNGNSDEVATGAILGAVIGGIAGNSMAGSTSKPCAVATPYNYQTGRYPQGAIPRTTDGLYGGPQSAGSYPAYPNTPPPSRTYPASTRPGPAYPSYPQPQTDARECQTITRETRLPDGRIIRDPVTTCRDPYDGTWVIEDGSTGYDDYDGYNDSGYDGY
ncbi:hypothetical protein HY29_07700 [Hyphomonas beringensis]|uniref:Uncharacterized protein n=1 Tax=Hyphomonas beringensis TaxID=1280946 RepID=A0A062ULL3_9PROT|nr:glycine zipper 2TM domain-containing protein [Hyphomonas beringensis]KCZ57020.1 hypothetical protein HY29_07700 [Hyphomonas beringensis]